MDSNIKIHKFAILKDDGTYESFVETKKRLHDELEERKKGKDWIGPLRFKKIKRKKVTVAKKKKPLKKKKPKPVVKKKCTVKKPKKKTLKKTRKRKKKYVNKHLFVTRFLLVTMNRGKRDKFLGKYSNIEDAYTAYNKTLSESDKIICPMLYNNSNGIIPVKHELALLKRIDKDYETTENILKNESGQLVPHILLNTETWYILDKNNFNIDETFFVYGYHPKRQRKNFDWILNNLITNELESKTMFKRIFVFLNKLVVVYDDNDIDMVICKNIQDSIRLYNLLETNTNKPKKNKQILFMGNVSITSDNRYRIYEYIKNKTNWLDKKILRNSTRP